MPESANCRWCAQPVAVTVGVSEGPDLLWIELCEHHVGTLQRCRERQGQSVRRWLAEVSAWWRLYDEPPPFGPPVT
ncbi:MAG TPA: hypothetical protein VIL64_04980 [Solirubrobacteraceae bacterium]